MAVGWGGSEAGTARCPLKKQGRDSPRAFCCKVWARRMQRGSSWESAACFLARSPQETFGAGAGMVVQPALAAWAQRFLSGCAITAPSKHGDAELRASPVNLNIKNLIFWRQPHGSLKPGSDLFGACHHERSWGPPAPLSGRLYPLSILISILCFTPGSDPLLHPQLRGQVLPGLQDDEGVPHRAHRRRVQGRGAQRAAALQRAEPRQGFHLPGAGRRLRGAPVRAPVPRPRGTGCQVEGGEH